MNELRMAIVVIQARSKQLALSPVCWKWSLMSYCKAEFSRQGYTIIYRFTNDN
jgi:hypothetical protein